MLSHDSCKEQTRVRFCRQEKKKEKMRNDYYYLKGDSEFIKKGFRLAKFVFIDVVVRYVVSFCSAGFLSIASKK